jgi:hypothetical protein
MRTENWQSNMRGLRLVGEDESGSASTTYGPVRAGLTTSQVTNKEVQLLESLKCLEKKVEILESKYLEVFDTFLSVTEALVRLSAFTNATSTTEEGESV